MSSFTSANENNSTSTHGSSPLQERQTVAQAPLRPVPETEEPVYGPSGSLPQTPSNAPHAALVTDTGFEPETILSDAQLIKARTMAPERGSDENFSDFLKRITVSDHYYVSPLKLIPGSQIRSMRDQWVQKLKRKVVERDGYVESSIMAITLGSDDLSKFRVIEGMHRATSTKELAQESERFKLFTLKTTLLMRFFPVQEVYVADKLNEMGDDRNQANFLSLLEGAQRKILNFRI